MELVVYEIKKPSSLYAAETFHDASGLTPTMMHRLLVPLVAGMAIALALANSTFSQTSETEGILRGTIIDQETSRPIRDVSVTLTGPLKPTDFELLHKQLETFDFASAALAGVDRTLSTIIAKWLKSATDTAISQRVVASDRNGMVVLRGVPAGDYLVGVERTGYFESFSNPADRTVFGRIVRVIARQTTEMTIPIVAGASVAGRLRNANNPSAEVSAFVINYLYGIPILVPQATAPGGASYKLENLPPGEYLIGVTGFPHVYHPSATDAHRATSVVIQGGENLSKNRYRCQFREGRHDFGSIDSPGGTRPERHWLSCDSQGPERLGAVQCRHATVRKSSECEPIRNSRRWSGHLRLLHGEEADPGSALDLRANTAGGGHGRSQESRCPGSTEGCGARSCDVQRQRGGEG